MAAHTEKILQLSKAPTHRGAIFQLEADEQGLVLLEAKEKSLKVYLLIDPQSDRILEVKFFTYGGPVYTAIAEVLCREFHEKTLSEALQIQIENIEKALRDQDDTPALALDGAELSPIVPILKILEDKYPEAKRLCMATAEVRSRIAEGKTAFEIRTVADQEWADASVESKIARIDNVLTAHVRHGLNMDGGDIEVKDVVDHYKVIVEYQGACGSCGSATGGTLFFIEDTLRKHIHPALKVEPVGLNF